VVPSEIAGLPLDAAFLMPFGRRAELAFKPPVRSKRDEARGLLPPVPAQDLLYRRLQIVVTELPEDTGIIDGISPVVGG
jgi:hypothetical protein